MENCKKILSDYPTVCFAVMHLFLFSRIVMFLPGNVYLG